MPKILVNFSKSDHNPKGVFLSVFCKGAITAFEGKEHVNPYEKSHGGFGAAYRWNWEHGYSGFKDGSVKVSEE